jgi:PAS domain S-box-containing protein
MNDGLKMDESLFQTIASMSPVGILFLDEELRCVFVNKRWSEIAGVAVEKRGPDCRSLGVHPEDHARIQGLWTDLVGKGEPYRSEYRISRPDGRTRWVLGEGAALKDEGGRTIGYVGSMTDITDRKNAEDEFSLHARITRHMAEGASLVRARDACIVYTNPKFDEMFGYGAGELVGRHVSAINAPTEKTPEETAAAIIAVLDKTGHWSGEVKNIRKDGSAFWCSAHVSVFTHPEHGPVWLSIHTDITEQKALKDRLEASQAMLQNVLDTIPVGVFWKGRDLKYLGGNMYFAKDAGFDCPADVAGKDDFQMSWSLDAEPYRADDREVMTTGMAKLNFEEPIKRPGMADRTVRTSKIPLRDRDGKIVGVLGVYEDVTERKRMREELVKAQKFESVGLLAGGIAHDFNNLLTTIMGNVSLAMDLSSRRGDLHNALDAARTAAFRAKDLAKQLLTLSKGGAPVKKAVDAGEFLRETARFALRGSGLACRFELPVDLYHMDVDEGLMSQVITNLLINARQAAPESGTVTIKAENRTLEAGNQRRLPAGRYVAVEIKDDGHGIAAEHMERIFDPYFTTKETGTGLGLAVCYSIMEKHGGSIDATSVPGSGATFTLHVPAADVAAIGKRPEEPLPIRGSGMVLVMDDEAAILELASVVLTGLGYEVHSANDGRKAVEMYRDALLAGNPFDVVVLDLTVPGGMGGRDAIREILALNGSARAIVSSGYSADPVTADFKRFGFKGFVEKPYTTAELSKAISDALKAE